MDDIDFCGLPRISTAPTWFDPDNREAIEAERKRWYASADDKGRLFAIQNPAVWVTRKNPNGTFTKIRPLPISIEEGIQRMRKASAYHNQRD